MAQDWVNKVCDEIWLTTRPPSAAEQCPSHPQCSCGNDSPPVSDDRESIPPGTTVVLIQVPLVVNVIGSKVGFHIGPAETVSAIINEAIRSEIALRLASQ